MTDINLICDVEQFYYKEARLLDDRKLNQWMNLLAPDIKYLMPNRSMPFPNIKLKETEEFLSVEHELSQGLDTPLRDENQLMLSLRVMRSFKPNSWTDNPPARTRRHISNVEVEAGAEEGLLNTYSNTLLYYNRREKENCLYSVQRRDILQQMGDSFVVKRREIIMDWHIIDGPSAGLFF